MKNNGPVTSREYPLGAQDTLLSATDLKGRIIYANDALIEVSGFDWPELTGKAHIVASFSRGTGPTTRAPLR